MASPERRMDSPLQPLFSIVQSIIYPVRQYQLQAADTQFIFTRLDDFPANYVS